LTTAGERATGFDNYSNAVANQLATALRVADRNAVGQLIKILEEHQRLQNLLG